MRREMTETDLEDLRSGRMKERLEELGYLKGGHFYEFHTRRTDLDSILDDIESETGLRFREGKDGHATLGGSTLRITSREEIPDPKLEEIEKVC